MVVSFEAFLSYKDLVTAYTPRNMGNIYDKLAAFDGIGNVLSRCPNSDLRYSRKSFRCHPLVASQDQPRAGIWFRLSLLELGTLERCD